MTLWRWVPHFLISSCPGDIRANIFRSCGYSGLQESVCGRTRSPYVCVHTCVRRAALPSHRHESSPHRAGQCAPARTHSWKEEVYASWLSSPSPHWRRMGFLCDVPAGATWPVVRLLFFLIRATAETSWRGRGGNTEETGVREKRETVSGANMLIDKGSDYRVKQLRNSCFIVIVTLMVMMTMMMKMMLFGTIYT